LNEKSMQNKRAKKGKIIKTNNNDNRTLSYAPLSRQFYYRI
jgi:hypothetical protein